MSITYSNFVFVVLGIHHAPYFHMWSVRLYGIFPRYLINDTFFPKEVSEHKIFVLIFSPQICLKYFTL